MERTTDSSSFAALRTCALTFACVAAAVNAEAATPTTSIFAPASTPARLIVDLSMFVLAVTGVIFVVVCSLLVYAVVKFRAKRARCRPRAAAGLRQHSDRAGVDGHSDPDRGGAVPGDGARDSRDPGCANSRRAPSRSRVIGHQFWWEYPLPAAGHRHGERAARAGERSRPSPTRRS